MHSSPRSTPRTPSGAKINAATPKTTAPPRTVTDQFRKEYRNLLDRLPKCDLDPETAVILTHQTAQRRTGAAQHERIQLRSAYDAQGRTVTWIEHVRGERSFPQSSSSISTPSKSKSKSKGKQRVEPSSDEGDVHVLPSTDDESDVVVTPTRTPRKSATKVQPSPSSSPRKAPVTPSKKAPSTSRLPIDESSESEPEPRMIGEPSGTDKAQELAEIVERLRLKSDTEGEKREPPLSPPRPTPNLDKLRYRLRSSAT
ncbi:hypothetical protein JCM3775_000511 [Rhodotorula graminis]